MKFRIAVVLILVIVAWAVGRRVNPWQGETGGGREERHETFQLEDGARVEVRGINGSVDVASADGNAAEVSIVRTAHRQSDLESSRVIVEKTGNSLVVRTEKGGGGGWWSRLFGGGGQVRHQVMLSVPRRSRLTIKGVNGPVKAGEMGAAVEVSGVNGRVELAEVADASQISGVNGGVSVGVAQLAGEGLRIKGVNGNVEIRLKEALSADVDIKGLNGGVSLNVPNVTMQEQPSRNSMRARLGAGGAPLTLTGINGSVRFESASR